jgi:hypothetical protein
MISASAVRRHSVEIPVDQPAAAIEQRRSGKVERRPVVHAGWPASGLEGLL